MISIFLINLDSSIDRLTQSTKKLAQVNAHFERISAVNGNALTHEEIYQHYDPKLNADGYYKELTAGEIGCYFSHRKAWQIIVERQLNYAIVLEDNFHLSGDLNAISDFISTQHPHFDYIKLADHPTRKRKVKHIQTIGSNSLVTFDKIPARTCAQLISFEGAKKLLAGSEKFGRPIDIDLQYWWEKNIRILGFYPFPFEPIVGIKSDITAVADRSSVKKNRMLRLSQQVRFKYRNFIQSSLMKKR